MADIKFILKVFLLISIQQRVLYTNGDSSWNPWFINQENGFQIDSNTNSDIGIALPNRPFDLCTYCRENNPWCVPLYCPGAIVVPPTTRDMCTYCRLYEPWCVPLYCTGQGFDALGTPMNAATGVRITPTPTPTGSFGELCSFCRNFYPACIHLYCPGGIIRPQASFDVSGSNGFVPDRQTLQKYKK